MASPTRRVLQTYVLKGGKLVLIATEDTPGTSSGIGGVTWVWKEFHGSDGKSIILAQPEQYTLQFLADGKVSIRADCNRGSGTYTLDGNNLSLSIMAMTMAACPPESLSDQYVRNLNDAASYEFHDGRLQLNLKNNSVTMIFAAETKGN